MLTQKVSKFAELFGRNFKFPLVPTGRAESIQEFFEKCMGEANVVPNADVLIGWHKMLCKFVDGVGNRLLLRMYESVNENGSVETRRGAVTRMRDGLEFAFASNYFARVMYTLAYLGFVPRLQEFEEMINNRLVCISYPNRTTRTEQDISAYRSKVGDAQYNTKRCYTPGWYLAHIVGVKSVPFRGYGNAKLSDFITAGDPADWRNKGGMVVRSIDRRFNEDELRMIKAHCLRFLDPINYFLVPSASQESHKYGKRLVGEDENVVRYALSQMKGLVGDDVYADFCERALVPYDMVVGDIRGSAETKIEIRFSSKRITKSTTSKKQVPVSRVKTQGGAKRIKSAAGAIKLSDEVILNVLRSYLVDGKSYRTIESQVLGLGFKVRGGGFLAKRILNGLGVNSTAKGILSTAQAKDYISHCSVLLKGLLKKLS